MFYNLCCLFMIFFIASVIGYLAEITFCSIQLKRVVLNRGFLMGPYIPIYGVGTSLVAIFLAKYKNDPFVFFWMTVILCSFVEYLTSYVMEKIFKVRWWDYREESFNINGRVCLKNSIIFGLAGLLVIYTVYPFICNIIRLLPTLILEILSICLLLVFLTDFIITVTTLIEVRSNLTKFKGMDATEIAHEEIMKAIRKHNFFISRLLQAFPKSEKFNRKEFIEFRKAVIEYRNKRKQLSKKRKSKNKEGE